MNAVMTRTLKYTVKEIRPDGGPYSFPSGHTANAFLGAHMAYKEFKDSSPVLAYSGYALALFVAGSRLYNNRHWVADVVAGAGFGILSVELAYLTYFPIRNAIARKINRKAAQNMVISLIRFDNQDNCLLIASNCSICVRSLLRRGILCWPPNLPFSLSHS